MNRVLQPRPPHRYEPFFATKSSTYRSKSISTSSNSPGANFLPPPHPSPWLLRTMPPPVSRPQSATPSSGGRDRLARPQSATPSLARSRAAPNGAAAAATESGRPASAMSSRKEEVGLSMRLRVAGGLSPFAPSWYISRSRPEESEKPAVQQACLA